MKLVFSTFLSLFPLTKKQWITCRGDFFISTNECQNQWKFIRKKLQLLSYIFENLSPLILQGMNNQKHPERNFSTWTLKEYADCLIVLLVCKVFLFNIMLQRWRTYNFIRVWLLSTCVNDLNFLWQYLAIQGIHKFLLSINKTFSE